MHPKAVVMQEKVGGRAWGHPSMRWTLLGLLHRPGAAMSDFPLPALQPAADRRTRADAPRDTAWNAAVY